jgi:hypothetical protein
MDRLIHTQINMSGKKEENKIENVAVFSDTG